MRERPPFPIINPTHFLAKGLQFAALGGGAGTLKMVDHSGYGNHGALTGYTTAGDYPADMWRWVPQLGRWGLGFDKSNDYVGTSIIVPSGSVTLAVRFNATAAGGDQCLFGQRGAAGNSGFAWRYGGTQFNGVTYGYADFNSGASSISTAAGTWYDAVLVMVPASTAATFYLNGRLVGTTSYVGRGVATNPLFVGANNNYGSPTLYFGGSLSDPMIWNRALSLPEIQILANPADPMLGGLIREPRARRNFVGQVGGSPPAATPWLWTPRRQRIIRGGV